MTTTQTGIVDYDTLEERALDFRPKLLICGGSAYPRDWDYARLRAIANKVCVFCIFLLSVLYISIVCFVYFYCIWCVGVLGARCGWMHVMVARCGWMHVMVVGIMLTYNKQHL